MKTNNKPTPEKTKRRACELLALGLSWNEVIAAAGISRSTLADLVKDPVYSRLVDDTRAEKETVAHQAASVIRDLLVAKDKDDNPDMNLRKIGAELYAKNPALVDAVDDDGPDELLPGCVLRVVVFPQPPPMS